MRIVELKTVATHRGGAGENNGARGTGLRRGCVAFLGKNLIDRLLHGGKMQFQESQVDGIHQISEEKWRAFLQPYRLCPISSSIVMFVCEYFPAKSLMTKCNNNNILTILLCCVVVHVANHGS